MPQVSSNGIFLEYERFGRAGDETILLIMGLGSQLIHWLESLCQDLAGRGYQVIRFDHRDIGLSTKIENGRTPKPASVLIAKTLGMKSPAAYTLEDMADDVVGLLDNLNIDKAHIVGASMGGMIAQLIAGHHPERTLSLTSIMSTTGHPSLPPSRLSATLALLSKPRDPNDPEAIIQRGIKLWKVIGSPAHPADDETLRHKVVSAMERSYYPAGRARHMAASLSARHRRQLLKTISSPALVLHGRDDPLIPVACGIDTARHLQNATLKVIPGMGHDFPEALMPVFADAIHEVARQAAPEN